MLDTLGWAGLRLTCVVPQKKPVLYTMLGAGRVAATSHNEIFWPCSEEGEEERARKAAEAAALDERGRIKAQREALPSFAYRDDFIKAVFEHQMRATCH